jgi:hypothetical protein
MSQGKFDKDFIGGHAYKFVLRRLPIGAFVGAASSRQLQFDLELKSGGHATNLTSVYRAYRDFQPVVRLLFLLIFVSLVPVKNCDGDR